MSPRAGSRGRDAARRTARERDSDRTRVPDTAHSMLRGGLVGMALVALATAGLTLAALIIAVVVTTLG